MDVKEIVEQLIKISEQDKAYTLLIKDKKITIHTYPYAKSIIFSIDILELISMLKNPILQMLLKASKNEIR